MCFIWWHSCLLFFHYYAFFSQSGFRFGHFLHLHYVHYKTFIGFALNVYQEKGYSFRMWDIFCGACSQWGEIASIMRKGRHFLITKVFYWAISFDEAPIQTWNRADMIRALTYLCAHWSSEGQRADTLLVHTFPAIQTWWLTLLNWNTKINSPSNFKVGALGKRLRETLPCLNVVD